jgi:cell division protein FtsL
MSETKPSDTVVFEPKRGKVVGRNVAIALGILCIILAVGIVGAFAYYIPIVSDKDNTLTTLNSQVSAKDSQISQLNSNITSLQNQVNDLTSNLNLAKSETWVNSQTVSQPAGSYNGWIRSTTYVGYVMVNVESSTTDKTYIEVLWYSYGIYYGNTISVGVSGTGVFPVFPSNDIEVRVGNSNLLNGATETVTITYHY